ncbi:MAG: mechanosensitive ion channel family protein [Anaerolineae bacterium]
MADFLNTFLLDLFNPVTLPGALFYALVFLGLALLGVRFVRVLTKRNAKRFPDPTAISFVSQLSQVGVFLGALILYAQLVPPLRAIGAALLAGVGVASIIFGLAAQSTLGNLIAGFALLLYRPFQVGDQVELNTPKGLQTGTIKALTLGYTLLHSADGGEIIVPNNIMASAVILKPPQNPPAE